MGVSCFNGGLFSDGGGASFLRGRVPHGGALVLVGGKVRKKS